jgi:hypothetical protein
MALRAPSVEDLKAGFVYERLDPISGEPTYATLQRLFTQLIRNATSVSSRLGGGQFGLSGLAKDPAVYLLRTRTHFNRPAYPGEQPVYPLGTTPAAQATILDTWTANTKEFLTVQRAETLLLMLLEKAIEDAYLTGIHDEAHGFGNRTLQDVQRWLFETYGHVGSTDRMNNTARLTQPIDPTAPLALLFKQIEECQRFAADAGSPFTPQQIVEAAEALIVQTGKYESTYKEWLALPATTRTYIELKRRFTQAYNIQNAMHRTAQQAGYHANLAAINEADDDDQNLAAAAHEFDAAEASRQTTVTQLATTNTDLHGQLANLATHNQHLQQQMTQMQQQYVFLATQQQRPAPTRYPAYQGRGRGRGGGHHSARQPTYPRVWAQATLPIKGQYQASSHTPGDQHPAPPRQRRHGNRRHLHGGPHWSPAMADQRQGPGAMATHQPTQHHGPAPWQNGSQPNPYQQHNGYRQQRPPNAKKYGNMNYCWTHGGDIVDNHTGFTCEKPHPQHIPHATRQNTMGGNPRSLTKVWTGS